MGYDPPPDWPLGPDCLENYRGYLDADPDYCLENPCTYLCEVDYGDSFCMAPHDPKYTYGVYSFVGCVCTPIPYGGLWMFYVVCTYCWVCDSDVCYDPGIPAASMIVNEQGWMPTTSMKWEPYDAADPGEKMIVLADWRDASNILVKYTPEALVFAYCKVTGTLVPDATAFYFIDGETNSKPAYSSPLRAFRIQWDGIDSWILAEQWAGPENPHWKLTNASVVGNYDPQCGATGIAAVSPP